MNHRLSLEASRTRGLHIARPLLAAFAIGGIGLWGATSAFAQTAPNAVPVAVADAASTVQGAPVTVSTLANDSDADNHALNISTLSAPLHGGAVVNANNTVTYTPEGATSARTPSPTP